MKRCRSWPDLSWSDLRPTAHNQRGDRNIMEVTMTPNYGQIPCCLGHRNQRQKAKIASPHDMRVRSSHSTWLEQHGAKSAWSYLELAMETRTLGMKYQ